MRSGPPDSAHSRVLIACATALVEPCVDGLKERRNGARGRRVDIGTLGENHHRDDAGLVAKPLGRAGSWQHRDQADRLARDAGGDRLEVGRGDGAIPIAEQVGDALFRIRQCLGIDVVGS